MTILSERANETVPARSADRAVMRQSRTRPAKLIYRATRDYDAYSEEQPARKPGELDAPDVAEHLEKGYASVSLFEVPNYSPKSFIIYRFSSVCRSVPLDRSTYSAECVFVNRRLCC